MVRRSSSNAPGVGFWCDSQRKDLLNEAAAVRYPAVHLLDECFEALLSHRSGCLIRRREGTGNRKPKSGKDRQRLGNDLVGGAGGTKMERQLVEPSPKPFVEF